MMSNKYHCLIVALAVFSCQIFIPVHSYKHHQNNDGLAVLLAAGLLAKILRHKHEEHHVHIPVPVHHHEDHHEHHEHHGSGSARMPMQHPAGVPVAMQHPAGVPVHGAALPMQHVYGGAMVGVPSHAIVRRIIYTAPQPQMQHAAPNPHAMPY